MNQEHLIEFEELLKTLLLPSNELRVNAEKSFRAFQTEQPDLCTLLLLSMQEFSQVKQVHALSLILLRQMVLCHQPPFWSNLKNETKEELRPILLKILKNEKDGYIRRKACDLTAIVGTYFISNDSWDELFEFILSSTNSNDLLHIETSLYLEYQLSIYLATHVEGISTELFKLFQFCLNLEGSLNAKSYCIKAISASIFSLSEKKKTLFNSLLTNILKALLEMKNAKEYDLMIESIDHFLPICRTYPNFFESGLSDILELFISFISIEEPINGLKQSSLNFLVELIERLPNLTIQTENFLIETLKSILLMISDLDDDDFNNNENESKYFEELENDFLNSNSYYGESSLTQISMILNEELLIEWVRDTIPILFDSKNKWQEHYTGLKLLMNMSEKCKDVFLFDLDQLLEYVFNFLNSSHPRIRHASLITLGQFCTDFSPILQYSYFEIILNTLEEIIKNEKYEFLKSQAAGVLVVFFEGSEEPGVYSDFYGNLLETLIKTLSEVNIQTQEQFLTAISAIILNGLESLSEYYDTLMELLKQILNEATSLEQRKLRAKAFECASLLGNTVTFEKFENDANEIIEYSINMYKNGLQIDDPQINSFFYGWSKICQRLSHRFNKYSGYIVPILLDQAEKKIETISLEQTNTDFFESDFDSENANEQDCSVVILGEKKTGIKTSSIEERVIILSTIYNICSSLKENYFPYIDQTLTKILPNVEFIYDEIVPSVAIKIIGKMVNCLLFSIKAKIDNRANMEYLNELTLQILKTLFSKAQKEKQIGVIYIIIQTINTIITVCEFNLNSKIIEQYYEEIYNLFLISKKRYFQLQEIKLNKFNENNNNSGELSSIDLIKIDEEIKDEEGLQFSIIEMFPNLIKFHQESFLPYLNDHILSYFIENLQSSNDFNKNRYLSLCVFDDLIQAANLNQEQFTFYWDNFQNIFLSHMNSKTPRLRQLASFGIQVCAEKENNASFEKNLEQVLQALHQTIQNKEFNEDNDFHSGTDCAIATLSTIFQRFPEKIPSLNEHLLMFFNYLPLLNDDDEAIKAHSHFVNFLDLYSQIFMTEKNFSQIFKIFSQILGTNFINQDTSEKILQIIQLIKKQFNEKQFNQFIEDINNQDLIQNFIQFI
ncbi:karyopherin (importin) beta [Anaeramoeba flamelloides]|uniref:Karyopherin (Importin) beta n=1 Tax=Anaeramoeba flamelloides TaxID=1746091 RepID=A0AAV7Y5Q8_9EUKA|nr:karyopherin (importin) beta [Anaeramoeba flamelloides]